jgi:hypothetical protein
LNYGSISVGSKKKEKKKRGDLSRPSHLAQPPVAASARTISRANAERCCGATPAYRRTAEGACPTRGGLLCLPPPPRSYLSQRQPRPSFFFPPPPAVTAAVCRHRSLAVSALSRSIGRRRAISPSPSPAVRQARCLTVAPLLHVVPSRFKCTARDRDTVRKPPVSASSGGKLADGELAAGPQLPARPALLPPPTGGAGLARGPTCQPLEMSRGKQSYVAVAF